MTTATSWSKISDLLLEATSDTLYMVGVSTLLAALLGIPLGVLLHLTAPGGLSPQPLLNRLLSVVVDFGRSLPFIVLLIAILPFTRTIAGTTLGPAAAVVPLTIGAIPFVGRLVDNALREVDASVVEAAVTTGASKFRIVRSVLLREAAPAVVAAIGVTAIALVGYSAMAGVVGAGGLGDVAVRFGYHRYDYRVMWVTVAVLAVLVIAIQLAFDVVARAIDRRRRVNA
ncbi:putative D-methionine transport system permease protein MetI [Longimycelium tulufanense]|uniref:Putative D-methionine transport system permease protein MetI n=1 Tax=Longimycelium tulufanense TaxID=907463 RepID=A0A8J3FYA3_9PSEU|nr:methionine ABC transporter permease [Longimycelium tulufanense]GGM74442.1 putative D-methionine transport system permease protein MetI [Longimycelium tulufanense]